MNVLGDLVAVQEVDEVGRGLPVLDRERGVQVTRQLPEGDEPEQVLLRGRPQVGGTFLGHLGGDAARPFGAGDDLQQLCPDFVGEGGRRAARHHRAAVGAEGVGDTASGAGLVVVGEELHHLKKVAVVVVADPRLLGVGERLEGGRRQQQHFGLMVGGLIAELEEMMGQLASLALGIEQPPEPLELVQDHQVGGKEPDALAGQHRSQVAHEWPSAPPQLLDLVDVRHQVRELVEQTWRPFADRLQKRLADEGVDRIVELPPQPADVIGEPLGRREAAPKDAARGVGTALVGELERALKEQIDHGPLLRSPGAPPLAERRARREGDQVDGLG